MASRYLIPTENQPVSLLTPGISNSSAGISKSESGTLIMSLVFDVPMVKRNTKRGLVWHVGIAVKDLLIANNNRQQLSWRNIKRNDDLQNMIKTLASWFLVPGDFVVAKFKS